MAEMAVWQKEWQNSRMAEMATYVLFTVDTHRRRQRRHTSIFYSIEDPTQPNWKITLPESMVVDTFKWFHQVMGHPGEKRLQEMLTQSDQFLSP
jgi:hypothetical protein